MNGVAAGVGLSLALACDIRIAADNAVLTTGFSRIGLIPDGGMSFMLPLLVGLGRAAELAFTSDRINAAEAHRLGLVNRVVPADQLGEATQALAQQLADMPTRAIGLTKRAFNQAILANLRRLARLRGPPARDRRAHRGPQRRRQGVPGEAAGDVYGAIGRIEGRKAKRRTGVVLRYSPEIA